MSETPSPNSPNYEAPDSSPETTTPVSGATPVDVAAYPAPPPASVFVGRDEPIAVFREMIEAPQGGRTKPLVFHGPPGIGKSTLLRVLYAILEDVAPPIPHAWFNARNITDHPEALRYTLATWRATLQSEFSLRFPRFDLCLALILAREANDEAPILSWYPALAPIYELAKPLLELPAQAEEILGATGTAGTSIAAPFWVAKGDDGFSRINRLCHLVLQDSPEVARQLLHYFLADFKDSLWGRSEQAIGGVLFFDSFEALWPGENPSLPEFDFYVAGWLRELAELCRESNILLVIGARQPLKWAEPKTEWADEDLQQIALPQLSPREAQEFLARCGIGPAHPQSPSSLQRAIMRSCSTTPVSGFLNQLTNRQVGESLPLWLGVCADIIINQRRTGKGDPGAAQFALVPSGMPGGKLCDMLLKSLPDKAASRWLRELALTPRCDNDAAAALASTEANDGAQNTAWQRFTEYSFVEDQGDGFYRIEQSVRLHLLEGRKRDETLEAHLNFFHHWSERGEKALAWFHQWAMDPREAVEKWTVLHKDALDASSTIPEEMIRARTLPGWWGEIALDERDLEVAGEKTWARAHLSLGHALQATPFLCRAPALALALGHCQASLLVYTSDESPREWAQTQIQMGAAQRLLAREAPSDRRDDVLRAAIERYQTTLRVATPQAFPREWGEIQLQLAGAHRDLLEMDFHGSSPHDYLGRAIGFYEEAMRLWSQARHPREWAHIQAEMGATFAACKAGGRARNLERALACIEQALTVFNEQSTPLDWAGLQAQRAAALAEMPTGDRAENLRQAITFYLSALRVYDAERTPLPWAETNLNLGLAWGELAYASDERNAYRNAVNYISTAANSFTSQGRPGEAVKAMALAEDISQSLAAG